MALVGVAGKVRDAAEATPTQVTAAAPSASPTTLAAPTTDAASSVMENRVVMGLLAYTAALVAPMGCGDGSPSGTRSPRGDGEWAKSLPGSGDGDGDGDDSSPVGTETRVLHPR